MFLKNCFIFIIIIVVVQGRPYTTNSGSSNIQVINRDDKKEKNNIHIKLDKTNSTSNPRTLDSLIDLYVSGIDGGLDLLEDALYAGKNSETTTTTTTATAPTPTTESIKVKKQTTTIPTTVIPSTSGDTNTEISDVNTTPTSSTNNNNKYNGTNYEILQHVNNLTDIIMSEFNNSLGKFREIRDDDPKKNEVELINNVEATTFKFDSSERQEEDDGNAVAGLISQFLSGLSRPDGGVDVDAIVGLISGLSMQREDGTYNFEGLTDLLMGFFGPESGSDVGAFVGGLLGATIKGLARPPGPKGAGIFTGTVLNGIIPAISGPPPPPEDDGGDNASTPKPMLDSGSFIFGLLKTILGGSSGGNMTSNGSGGSGGHFTQAKNQLVKLIFQIISTVFSVSSSSSSSKKG